MAFFIFPAVAITLSCKVNPSLQFAFARPHLFPEKGNPVSVTQKGCLTCQKTLRLKTECPDTQE